jgi:hypothetical protein
MDEKHFYEDDLDALRATIQRLGGNKAAGAILWPDKTPEGAARSMADCCNPSRSERLSPSQLLLVMRLAREKGCHILAEHFMIEAGYAVPVPVDPEDEASRVIHKMDSMLQAVGVLADRLERMRNRTSIRAVG